MLLGFVICLLFCLCGWLLVLCLDGCLVDFVVLTCVGVLVLAVLVCFRCDFVFVLLCLCFGFGV